MMYIEFIKIQLEAFMEENTIFGIIQKTLAILELDLDLAKSTLVVLSRCIFFKTFALG